MKLARACGAALAVLLCASYGCSVLVGPGELDEGCSAQQKACGQKCVARDDPDFGCAADTCRPCVVAHATARCSAEGECAVATCQGQFSDCNADGDQRGSDGCEVDTAHDALHCGGCRAAPCSAENGIADCAGGRCSIMGCDAGFRDCNFDPSDGCEIELSTDRQHCGDCDHSCAERQTCFQAQCIDSI